MAETIASMMVRLGLDTSDFDKWSKEFKKTWGKPLSEIQSAGKEIGLAFAGIGAGLGVALGGSVKKAADFESQMAKAGAVAGASGDDLEAMKQAALELGASTSLSSSQVAQAMTEMAAKGYTAQQIIAAMPGVISAAEASGEDLALVADTTASALNAFGLEASDATRVADVLAKSANTSAAGVSDLQYAFKYAAPVANSLGISMEELAAATGIMANSGMKGEMAGTTLRSALLSLTDPSKEAKKTMDELGISVTDAQGNFLPFDQIIQQLSLSTANMTDAQKAAALSTIFGKEAMTGMLSLVEAGPEKFRAMTTELQNSSGASATAAALMKDNLGGSMQELSGAVESLQISLGTALAPAIQKVVEWLTGLVNWFNQLSPQTKEFVAVTAAVVAGFAGIAASIALASSAFAGIMRSINTARLAMTVFSGGIAGIIVAVAMLAVLIATHWDEIRATTVRIWNGVKSFLSSTWDSVRSGIESAWNGIKGFFEQYWPLILGVFTGGIGLVVGLLVENWDSISETAKRVWNGIKSFFSETWDDIKKTASNLWNDIKSSVMEKWNWLKDKASEVFGDIESGLSNTWNNIKSTAETVWDGIVSSIKGTINSLIGIINKFIDGFNKIKITVPSVDIPLVGKVGGFTIGMPQIPKIPALATGTNYVPNDMLAYIHKGEAVVPREYNPAAGGGASSGGTIVIELDGRVIAQKTFERLGGTLRMRGAVT